MLVIMDGYCHKLERTKMDKINQKYVKALEAAASEGVLIYQGYLWIKKKREKKRDEAFKRGDE